CTSPARSSGRCAMGSRSRSTSPSPVRTSSWASAGWCAPRSTAAPSAAPASCLPRGGTASSLTRERSGPWWSGLGPCAARASDRSDNSRHETMARYIQRIALLGKERWIGWEIDGVGTEVAGLMLADELSPEELRTRGVKEFHPLDFETFLGMNPEAGKPAAALLDEDIDFRLDALQVGMERIRGRGESAVPRSVL